MATIQVNRNPMPGPGKLHLDIYTIVFEFLNLEDAVSLLRVSPALYRAHLLWCISLENAKNVRPLPCPFDQKFPKLTLDELRKIAYKTLYLTQTWSQKKPKYRKAVQMDIPCRLEPIASVPGYPVVIGWVKPGALQCWNVETKTCLGTIEGVYNCERDRGCTASKPYLNQGRLTFAVFSCQCLNSTKIEECSSEIVMVSVDYAVKDAMKFFECFRKTIVYDRLTGPPKRHAPRLTLFSPEAGLVILHDTFCVAFNSKQEKMRSYAVTLPLYSGWEEIYWDVISLLNVTFVEDFCFQAESTVAQLPKPKTDVMEEDPFDLWMSGVDPRPFHLYAVYVNRTFGRDTDRLSLRFRNHSDSLRYDFSFDRPRISSPLSHTGFQHATGSEAVLFTTQDEKLGYFTLYRFHPYETPHTCTAHCLSLPVSHPTSSENLEALIDDHLGILYLFDENMVSAFFYA